MVYLPRSTYNAYQQLKILIPPRSDWELLLAKEQNPVYAPKGTRIVPPHVGSPAEQGVIRCVRRRH